MKIKLNKLKLHNFKGIKDFEIEFTEETNIFGDNGTGKTTLFDAYLWLLFDKDSSNASNFNIKTLDSDGNPIHHLEHSVEGSFEIDNKEITFKKVYKEKWTKKRGSSNPEFDGHTTDYFVNDVPVKLKEYKSRIESIVDEDTFKLISNPRYFSVDLNKDKRREILLSLSDITDNEIIKSNKELKDLDLSSHTISDLEKMTKANRKLLNNQLTELPVRIDELNLSLKDFDFDALEFQKNSKIGSINHIDEMLASNDYSSLRDEVSQKSNKLLMEKLELTSKVDIKNAESEREVNNHNNKLKTEYETSLSIFKENQEEIKRLKADNENLQKKLLKRREEWIDLNKQDMNVEDSCPTCKQSLPQDQVQKAIEIANVAKSERLEEISKEGKSIRNHIEHNIAIINKLETQEEVKEPEYMAFIKEEYPERIAEIDKEIKNLRESLTHEKSDESMELINKKKQLNLELDELNKQLAYKDTNEETKAKIDEYRAQMKDISSQFDEVERVLYLIDLFNRTKAEMISKDISEKFKLVDWKLFETQINGGINEVCEATVNGVPYADVNNANKINAGIDIINMLSKHYGITAPIFVDNAESVNELIDTDSQIVRLVVSTDKKLRVK